MYIKFYKFFTMFIWIESLITFSVYSRQPFLLASWIRKIQSDMFANNSQKINKLKMKTNIIFFIPSFNVKSVLFSIFSTTTRACYFFFLRLSFIDRHKKGENEIMPTMCLCETQKHVENRTVNYFLFCFCLLSWERKI